MAAALPFPVSDWMSFVMSSMVSALIEAPFKVLRQPRMRPLRDNPGGPLSTPASRDLPPSPPVIYTKYLN